MNNVNDSSVMRRVKMVFFLLIALVIMTIYVAGAIFLWKFILTHYLIFKTVGYVIGTLFGFLMLCSIVQGSANKNRYIVF